MLKKIIFIVIYLIIFFIFSVIIALLHYYNSILNTKLFVGSTNFNSKEFLEWLSRVFISNSFFLSILFLACRFFKVKKMLIKVSILIFLYLSILTTVSILMESNIFKITLSSKSSFYSSILSLFAIGMLPFIQKFANKLFEFYAKCK